MILDTIPANQSFSGFQVARATSHLLFNIPYTGTTVTQLKDFINTELAKVKLTINYVSRQGTFDIVKTLTLRELVYHANLKGSALRVEGSTLTIVLPLSFGKTLNFTSENRLEIEGSSTFALPITINYINSCYVVAGDCCTQPTYNNMTTELFKFVRYAVPSSKDQNVVNENSKYLCAMFPTLNDLDIYSKGGELTKLSTAEMDTLNAINQTASVVYNSSYYSFLFNEFMLDMTGIAKLNINNQTNTDQFIYLIEKMQ